MVIERLDILSTRLGMTLLAYGSGEVTFDRSDREPNLVAGQTSRKIASGN
jgi:hypothetical protein